MKHGGTNVLQWKQIFQGNVFAFGLVSFLTDLSTEMIYPLLPVFFIGAFLAASAVFMLAGSLVSDRNKKSLLNAEADTDGRDDAE